MEAQIKRHEPLYLKHRPQALDQLVGQEAVTRTLTNAINYERLSHAYLFTGPRGTGKTSTARILAKSLNCKASDKATITPCQQCTSCLEIKNGTSPAVLEIDAASNNSVDDARVLIERAPLVAPGGRFKIYIIDECHMLTKEAFNALLKTIEDPPPNVIFVLATTEEHKVLPTIVSRCQRLMFRLVTQDDLLMHLRAVASCEGIEITDRALEFVARRSGGGLRDALGLLDQSSLLSAPGHPVDVTDLLALLGALHEDVLLEMSDHVLHRRGQELLGSAGRLLQEGREPSTVVQELARHFLNLAKASYLVGSPNREDGASEMIVGSPGYVTGLFSQAPQFERSELTQLVEALDRLEQACRRTTQPAMHLEVGLLALCHRHDMLLVRELADRVAHLEHALSGSAPRPAPPPRPVAAHAPAPPVVDAARMAALPGGQPVEPGSAGFQPAPAMTPAPPAHAPAPPAHAPAPVASTAVETAVGETRPTQSVSSVTVVAQPIPVAPKVEEPPPKPHEPEEDKQASADELDSVWSGILDELQRRHIPTFSLVSVHGVPLSLNARELNIGTKETFIKTLEMKLDHIKAAASSVVGNQINVRVRQITADMQASKPVAKPRERAAATAAPPPSSSRPSSPDDDDDSEPADSSYTSTGITTASSATDSQSAHSAASANTVAAGESPRGTEPALSESAPTASMVAAGESPLDPDDDTMETAEPAPTDDATQSASPVAAKTAERGNDGTIIKEAYKLFEGPGSRQIGDKKK